MAKTDPIAGSYLTIDELERRWMSPEQLEQLAGGADFEPLLQQVLKAASAEVDSFATGRYTVPLQPSERVKQLVAAIARYRLMARKRVAGEQERRDYEDAIKFLTLIAKGDAGLDQPAGEEAQTVEASALGTKIEERFGEDKLGGL